MFFLLASLNEFLQFLKIVMWISIPLFVVSTLIVVFMHYRKKRRLANEEEPDLKDLALAAVPVGQSAVATDFFQRKLQSGREQYLSLRQDFQDIQSRYTLLFSAKENSYDTAESPNGADLEKQLKQCELKIAQLQQAIEFIESNKETHNINEQTGAIISEKDKELQRLQAISEQLNREIALLRQQNDSKDQEVQKLDRLLKEMQESARHASNDARDLQLSYQQQHEERDRELFEENNKLKEQFRQLSESYRKLEEEHRELQLRMQDFRRENLIPSEYTMRIESLENALQTAQQEATQLKAQLIDSEAAKEIASEKHLQLELLQNQLEQRIRANIQLEQINSDSNQLLVQLEDRLKEIEKEKGFLLEDNALKAEEIQRQQQQLDEGSAETRALKEQLLQREANESRLSDQLAKMKETIAQYESEIHRNRNLAGSLEEQLQLSKEHAALMEEKLVERQQLLAQIHEQVAGIVNSEQVQPVLVNSEQN